MKARSAALAALSLALACWLVPVSAWGAGEEASGPAPAAQDSAAAESEPAAEDDPADGGREDGAGASEGPQDPAGPADGGVAVGDGTEAAAPEDGSGDVADAEGEEDVDEGEGAPDGPAVADGAYFVRSAANADFVLDVADASVENGADVRLWSANGSNAQRFWVSNEGGVCRVQAMCSGKALSVEDPVDGGAPDVTQWLFDEGSASQAWEIASNDDGTFTLVSCANGLALDVADGIAFAGADVRTWERNGAVAQKFVLEPTDSFRSGMYSVSSVIDANMVVDVPDLSRDAGVATHLWERNGGFAQKFLVESAGDGSFTISPLCSGLLLTDLGGTVVQAADAGDASRWRIVAGPFGTSFLNEATRRALDVADGIAENARRVGTYAVNGTRAQGFFCTPVEAVTPGVYRITCASDGRAIDTANASLVQGANVHAWEDNGTGAQRWRVKTAGEGLIVMKNARSNMALDVAGFGTEPGTNVQAWLPTENEAQQFVPIPSGDGYFFLQSVCSGLYLDVADGGGWNGANVRVWTPNKTAAQKFCFTLASYDRTMDEVREGMNAASGTWEITGFGGYTPSSQVATQLQNAVNVVRYLGRDVGFLMIDVETGQGVACNADGSFYSASTVKGPYVASVCSYYPWAIGSWPGTMESTIRWSSNDGYASLRSAFGSPPLRQWCAWADVGTGVASTWYPWYSARDLAKLWTVNYEYFTGNVNGSRVGSWYDSSLNSQLYYQLGGRYRVQSKPGWYPGGTYAAANDAGIVWADNGPYVAAILTSVSNDTSRISDLVWAIEAAHNEMMAAY